MREFWNNLEVKKYLFFDIFDIDGIVEEFGECKNDYEIKRNYYIIDSGNVLNKGGVIDITRDEYDKFIIIPTELINRYYDMDYEEFIETFLFDRFEKKLNNEIVPNSQSNFISLVNETFFTFNFEAQAKMFLRELISLLSRFSIILKEKDRKIQYYDKNSIQEIVTDIYSESYLDTIQKIKANYKSVFPEIENNFNLNFELESVNFLFANENRQGYSFRYKEINELIAENKHWFKVGILFAKGEIQKLRKENPKISFAKIAEHFNNKNYEVYIKATNNNYTKTNPDKNIYINFDKMDLILKHCKLNDIAVCDDFDLKYKALAEKQY
jgi:hypothetical protein